MRPIAAVVLASLFVGAPRPSAAFSVIAHQAVVDAAWETSIVPALRRRFPHAGSETIERARAFAYGGSHLPDLGYFPLGNTLFTDLVHYVRSGEFVATLLGSAETVDEYAFALGVLSHYVTDDTGHPRATNRTVPEIYPNLRRKYGDVVTYAEDPKAHLQTEFRFDVLQLARSRQSPDLFRHEMEFEVSEPVLDRAFVKTYGLHLSDLFASTPVAITTYRWAFRAVIHEATGIAWELYRADIQRVDPVATPKTFIANLSRTDFEKEFGKAYREPGYPTKFFALLVKLVPNVGPLKRLPYKALPEDARRRFAETLDRTIARYRTEVDRLRAHRGRFPNENLDVGRPTRGGEYEPADVAYAKLLDKLADRDFADVPSGLRADILRFYGDGTAPFATKEDDDEWGKVREELARLEASPTGARRVRHRSRHPPSGANRAHAG